MRATTEVCDTSRMRTGKAKWPLAAMLAAGALLMMSGVARAGDTICTGVLAQPVGPTNVIVPAGQWCTLDGVRVKGNIIVFGNLNVDTYSGDTLVDGNIDSKNGCSQITITLPTENRVVISGNVDIEHCFSGWIGKKPPEFAIGPNNSQAAGPSILIGKNLKCNNNSNSCEIMFTVVGGNLEASGNLEYGAIVGYNFVGGNLTMNNNSYRASLYGNIIGNDLKCAGNYPLPDVIDNLVGGAMQGQCAP